MSKNPLVKIEPLLRTAATSVGQKIRFPDQDSEIAASIVEIPPGVEFGWHSHPYLRCGYILEGTVTVEEADGSRKEHSAGSFVVEAQEARHRGMNLGAGPVRILVIDLAKEGHSNHREEEA